MLPVCHSSFASPSIPVKNQALHHEHENKDIPQYLQSTFTIIYCNTLGAPERESVNDRRSVSFDNMMYKNV